jgi:hypothetical protein
VFIILKGIKKCGILFMFILRDGAQPLAGTELVGDVMI